MLNFFVLNNEFTQKHWKKISKDKNDATVPHLEIADVILGHCNVFNVDYQWN